MSATVAALLFGLNPFFIRSGGSTQWGGISGRRIVLIPSSSGLVVQLVLDQGVFGAKVLIPSSSGLVVQHIVDTMTFATFPVLIPSSSGLVVQLTGDYEYVVTTVS